MSTKNLSWPDAESAPVMDAEYFIPLTLRLDSNEKAEFKQFFETTLLPTMSGMKALYSPLGDCSKHFPKTIKQTVEFLKPVGLTVRHMTVFVSPPHSNIQDVKNIHIDSTRLPNDQLVILEGRLSYYEMADTPGVVRWFPGTGEYTSIEELVPGKVISNIWSLPWIQDLKEGRIGWEQAPDWTFATSTNTPSGFIRTNLPHHVIQGAGNRLTISAQLIFANTRSPVGVWQHLQQNYHLLGI